MPTSFIWGYEESENNIEITNCIGLADEFWSFMYNDIAQIILTTHSPVFYNLSTKNTAEESYVSCHHIYLESSTNGTEITHNSTELDEYMGTMSLFAPKIRKLEKKIRDQELAKFEVQKLATDSRAKIFVEGPSDKLIIEKSIAVFCPNYSDRIAVETKDGGAGHTYVYDMLSAWHSTRTHDNKKPKAAGLVDGDTPGSATAKKWNIDSSHTKSCKCFKLKTPKKLHGAFKNKFRVPITLEIMYPREIWDWSKNKQHLEERSMTDILPTSLTNDIIKGDKKLSDILDDEWGIYVKYDYPNDRKIAVATYLSGKTDDEFKQLMGEFEEISNDIIDYLFKEEIESDAVR